MRRGRRSADTARAGGTDRGTDRPGQPRTASALVAALDRHRHPSVGRRDRVDARSRDPPQRPPPPRFRSDAADRARTRPDHSRTGSANTARMVDGLGASHPALDGHRERDAGFVFRRRSPHRLGVGRAAGRGDGRHRHAHSGHRRPVHPPRRGVDRTRRGVVAARAGSRAAAGQVRAAAAAAIDQRRHLSRGGSRKGARPRHRHRQRRQRPDRARNDRSRAGRGRGLDRHAPARLSPWTAT